MQPSLSSSSYCLPLCSPNKRLTMRAFKKAGLVKIDSEELGDPDVQ